MLAQQDVGLGAALRQIYGFLTPARRRHFFFVLALMVLGSLAELATIASILPFLTLLSGSESAGETPLLHDVLGALGALSAEQRIQASAALFILVVLIAAAIRLLLTWSTQRFVLRLGHDIAVEIQRRVLFQPYSYHTQHNSSEVLASLEKVQVLVFSVLLQLMYAATAAMISVVLIAALIRLDPFTATIATFTFAALYLLVSSVAARRLSRNSKVSGKAYQERLKLIQESLGGIRDVIVDHSQAAYVEAFRSIDRRFSEAKASNSFIAVAPRFVVEAAGMVVIAALALVLSGRAGGLNQAVPILGAMALGALRLLPFLQQFYYGWTSLAGNRRVAGQVLELLRLPVSAENEASSPPVPFESAIRFDDVSFTYGGARRPALKVITLSIPRGARVAVVGRTGSGKSTLADLLMGLLHPSEGTITIDGVAITAANRRAWRRSIAHVPQAIFLADTTIARNIAFSVPGEAIDEAKLATVARIAQLDEWVAELPDGFETQIGEGGVRLSGGQRQRLGIARAVYKDAPLLILDEATNALDEASEDAVMRALDDYAADRRTIIMITHRPSRVAACDLVIRLENGRIAEMVSARPIKRGAGIN